MPRLTFAIALASAIGLSAGASFAADLDPVFAPPQPAAQPIVELGSGWYLRGDAGWGSQSQAQIFADIPTTSSKDSWSSWSGDLGAGYKFNEWFRADLTIGESAKQKSSASAGSNVVCPYALQGETDQVTGYQLGYLWSSQAGTCNGKDSSKLSQGDLLLNGYVDFGTWAGFTPYVGAGVGIAQVHSEGQIGYYKTSDGTLYTADLTPTGTYPLIWVDGYGNQITPQPTVPTNPGTPVNFSKQSWLRTFSQTKYNLAWALMGGVAYNINHNLTLDVGFRYLNNGTYKSIPGIYNTNSVTKTLSTEEVRVGLRYLLD